MFIISEAETAAVLATYRRAGEWAAVVELRRLFTGIQDNASALQAVRAIMSRAAALEQ